MHHLSDLLISKHDFQLGVDTFPHPMNVIVGLHYNIEHGITGEKVISQKQKTMFNWPAKNFRGSADTHVKI